MIAPDMEACNFAMVGNLIRGSQGVFARKLKERANERDWLRRLTSGTGTVVIIE